MTLDEGGFLAEGLVPGVDKTVAMINLAEKGFASFELTVETKGGHSSQPPKENTIGMLAQAIVDLENNQQSLMGSSLALIQYLLRNQLVIVEATHDY
mgnify:CR=1 FL=1